MSLKIKLRGRDINPHICIAVTRIRHVSGLGLRAWIYDFDYKAKYVALLNMSSVPSTLYMIKILFQSSPRQIILIGDQALFMIISIEDHHLYNEPESLFYSQRPFHYSESAHEALGS